MKVDVRNLVNRLAAEEERLSRTPLLAPCVKGGRVRAVVAGFVCTFTPEPRGFEGWAIFQPAGEGAARVVEEADLARVSAYLSAFPTLRLRLAFRLRGATWLAYPSNESDARQRFSQLSEARPVALHLVTDGQEFEQVIARRVGDNWWFEELDRRASPIEAERLRAALKNRCEPAELDWKGITPEMRACYSLRLHRRRDARRARLPNDETRLREALRFGGGDLQSYRDRGDFWLVEWTTGTGENHTSAIAKSDLTVISAGVCLSDEDEKFDLQSLVRVVEEWN